MHAVGGEVEFEEEMDEESTPICNQFNSLHQLTGRIYLVQLQLSTQPL